jgi:hypothetical protein
MISILFSEINSGGYFILIKSLCLGIRKEDCLGIWDFVDLFVSEVGSDLKSYDFLAELQLIKSAFVGLKLLTSTP